MIFSPSLCTWKACGGRWSIGPGRPCQSRAGWKKMATELFAEFWNGMLAQRQGDILQLGVKIKSVFAAFAVGAGEFHAAKRGGQVADVMAVDPGHAGLNAERHAVGARDVASPDIRCQAVAHAVGFSQGIVFVLEGNGGQYRAENFLLRDTHPVLAGK